MSNQAQKNQRKNSTKEKILNEKTKEFIRKVHNWILQIFFSSYFNENKKSMNVVHFFCFIICTLQWMAANIVWIYWEYEEMKENNEKQTANEKVTTVVVIYVTFATYLYILKYFVRLFIFCARICRFVRAALYLWQRLQSPNADIILRMNTKSKHPIRYAVTAKNSPNYA